MDHIKFDSDIQKGGYSPAIHFWCLLSGRPVPSHSFRKRDPHSQTLPLCSGLGLCIRDKSSEQQGRGRRTAERLWLGVPPEEKVARMP